MNMSLGKILVAVIFALAVIAVPWCVEWVDAGEIMVVQYPNGSMEVFSEPGPAPEWFGSTTTYRRQYQTEFDNDKDLCKSASDSRGYPPLRVRFAEGGHGFICGALRWELPGDKKQMIEIQKDFGNPYALETTLVSRALNQAVYLSGQTMTSTESAAERRGELLHYIEDQLKNGIYKTVTEQQRAIDPTTKQERTISVVRILRDKEGQALRQNISAFSQYGIQVVQTTITEMPYEPSVENQINAQQQARAQVRIAIEQALKAEQDAKTVAEQGKANAAKAEWEQKTVAARQIELARQEKVIAETHAAKLKEVSRLEKEAAEFTKQRDILLGQGESEKRRLILAADGALEKKLEAYVQVNRELAQAIKEAKPGAWSPQVAFGAGVANGQVAGTQGMNLIELLTAKTARDLQLDMSVSKK